MILVDTSIWINLLGKKPRFQVQPEQLLLFMTCSPILQEVLQGVKDDPVFTLFKERFLALPRIGDPLLLDDYLAAAEIYRVGRRKGFTIRSSVDCLIAALAIKEKISVWHADRDYDAISQFTSLKVQRTI